MKNAVKKVLSIMLVAVMLFGAAPLNGFVDLELFGIRNTRRTKMRIRGRYTLNCFGKLIFSIIKVICRPKAAINYASIFA